METHGTSPVSAASFRMIDIGEKKDTQRRAIASGVFFASPQTIQRIRERTLPKGDVLTLAEMAGIQGAKKTSDLLPLCHPLPLTSVRVWMEPKEYEIHVYCEAKAFGKTGVEMEALCGVNAALLCIYDLTKGIDPVLRIGDIRLEIKEGGKSGQWINPESKTAKILLSQVSSGIPEKERAPRLNKLNAAVITLSDRCARKEAQDLSGPCATQWLEAQGAKVKHTLILPDETKTLRNELTRLVSSRELDLIITTGGTGLSTRDITPDAVLSLAHELQGREIPGFGELLRQKGSQSTPHSWLSRSVAVIVKNALIVCLPGSPKAVEEGLNAVGDLIPHALHTHQGGGHESSTELHHRGGP